MYLRNCLFYSHDNFAELTHGHVVDYKISSTQVKYDDKEHHREPDMHAGGLWARRYLVASITEIVKRQKHISPFHRAFEYP